MRRRRAVFLEEEEETRLMIERKELQSSSSSSSLRARSSFLRLVRISLTSLVTGPSRSVPSPREESVSSLEGSAETTDEMNDALGSAASASLLLGWSFSWAARTSLRRLEARVGAGCCLSMVELGRRKEGGGIWERGRGRGRGTRVDKEVNKERATKKIDN